MTDEFKCNCDCDCNKPNDREGEQCEDCDNGTHWDEIKKVYVDYPDNYEDED